MPSQRTLAPFSHEAERQESQRDREKFEDATMLVLRNEKMSNRTRNASSKKENLPLLPPERIQSY